MDGRGSNKVAWEQVCTPRAHGEVGIQSVRAMNLAIMSKHIWHILTRKPHSIWVSWVHQYRLKRDTYWTYHGSEGSWGWKQLLKLHTTLISSLEYKVGDDSSFRLWLDPWHTEGPLIHKCPRGPRITGFPADSLLEEVLADGRWN
ncbi:UNVERIFIED_CONTAM: hypothetical protein Slati_2667700 [Sesamum latifolium]|uniref:Uncharacterized protein n=1 Tax=Sesamum latifolium TaxID=2727402 RepID=A0AAW2VWJ8_9LAMI